MTGERSGYRDMGKFFASHGTTAHGRGQYVNLEDRSIHTFDVDFIKQSGKHGKPLLQIRKPYVEPNLFNQPGR